MLSSFLISLTNCKKSDSFKIECSDQGRLKHQNKNWMMLLPFWNAFCVSNYIASSGSLFYVFVWPVGLHVLAIESLYFWDHAIGSKPRLLCISKVNSSDAVCVSCSVQSRFSSYGDSLLSYTNILNQFYHKRHHLQLSAFYSFFRSPFSYLYRISRDILNILI